MSGILEYFEEQARLLNALQHTIQAAKDGLAALNWDKVRGKNTRDAEFAIYGRLLTDSVEQLGALMMNVVEHQKEYAQNGQAEESDGDEGQGDSAEEETRQESEHEISDAE